MKKRYCNLYNIRRDLYLKIKAIKILIKKKNQVKKKVETGTKFKKNLIN